MGLVLQGLIYRVQWDKIVLSRDKRHDPLWTSYCDGLLSLLITSVQVMVRVNLDPDLII